MKKNETQTSNNHQLHSPLLFSAAAITPTRIMGPSLTHSLTVCVVCVVVLLCVVCTQARFASIRIS